MANLECSEIDSSNGVCNFATKFFKGINKKGWYDLKTQGFSFENLPIACANPREATQYCQWNPTRPCKKFTDLQATAVGTTHLPAPES